MYMYSLKSCEIISHKTLLNVATTDPIDTPNGSQVTRKERIWFYVGRCFINVRANPILHQFKCSSVYPHVLFEFSVTPVIL